MSKLNQVKVDESKLLKKGYRVADLVDKTITVTTVEKMSGDSGIYLLCDILGDGLETGRKLVTGSQNVVERLLAAKEQNLLPVEVTVRKISTSAYDIE